MGLFLALLVGGVMLVDSVSERDLDPYIGEPVGPFRQCGSL